MHIKNILILLVIISMTSLVNASLGNYNVNTCVPIIVPLNSSIVTITSLVTPNGTMYNNLEMTKIGNSFNYTFCDTKILGTYNYGFCDDTGTCYGNDFTIVRDQQYQELNLSNVLLFILGFVFLGIVFYGSREVVLYRFIIGWLIVVYSLMGYYIINSPITMTITLITILFAFKETTGVLKTIV